jgi:F-type H+-transporting ATPase subunit b
LEQLGINVPAILAQIVNFGLLLLILRAVAYQPMLRILDERAARARETAELAEVAKRQVRHADEEYAARRAEALRQGQEIVARANEAAERIFREAEERARHVSDQFLAKSRDEIGRERELAVAQIRREMADIAVLAAGKVINSTLNPADHYRLVEEALAEAERAQQSQQRGGN